MKQDVEEKRLTCLPIQLDSLSNWNSAQPRLAGYIIANLCLYFCRVVCLLKWQYINGCTRHRGAKAERKRTYLRDQFDAKAEDRVGGHLSGCAVHCLPHAESRAQRPWVA